jgi:hypothetical protein
MPRCGTYCALRHETLSGGGRKLGYRERGRRRPALEDKRGLYPVAITSTNGTQRGSVTVSSPEYTIRNTQGW